MAGHRQQGCRWDAFVLPPDYRAILLQAWHIDAQAAVRNIADEFLAVLQQWSQEGKVICGHMIMDAEQNMLAALNAVGFEGIVYVVQACGSDSILSAETELHIKGSLAACTEELEEWRKELSTEVCRVLGT